MSMMPILIVASVLGVQWGWQPVAGGGIEYIIRVEPHAVEALRSGRDIFSDLPPQIQRVRNYRITVSNDPVPHEGEMPPANVVEAAVPESASTAPPSLRPPLSGTATAARQPVDDDATPPPPAATAPFADTPLGEQSPPTFQPPAAPPQASAPPAAAVEETGRSRREWPERRERGAATTAPPNFAPPPGSNSGFSNSGAMQAPPAGTGAPSGNMGGPNLQPPAGAWPNRPSYDQTNSAPPPNSQPAGFGPMNSSQQPAIKNDWYNPPTAGQDPRNGSPGNGLEQGRNGQAQQNYGSPPFSTQGKHSNATLAQNFAAAQDQAVAEVESKPWVLVVTLLVLFASVGLNVYLGMISWDLYERYRTTIDQLKTATEARVA